jgi:hypothetical protein
MGGGMILDLFWGVVYCLVVQEVKKIKAMKLYSAKIYLDKINNFESNLKQIDLLKADKKRNGHYTIALEQLKELKDGKLELEDIFGNPDNILRNIIMLSELDKTDNSTKKL